MTEQISVVVADAAALDAVAAELRADRWSVQQGFALPADPWELGEERRACIGIVTDDESGSDAVFAAVRGVRVALCFTGDVALAARVVDDLSRVGGVDDRRGTAPPADPSPLDDEQRALLALLRDGSSVAQAAAALHLSPRTAERRLGAARKALGVRTTAEAVLRADDRSVGPPS